jgi:alditol oxidase
MPEAATVTRTNWAGNVTFSARELHRPTGLAQLRELVAGHDRVKALGTGHSFNRIADTDGVLISLAAMPRVLEIDPAAGTARVGAGLPLYEVCAALRANGLALANLPSSAHFTVAGACATGTHGSGDAHGTLASFVGAVELVTADGAVRTLARGDDGFEGAVVSLGALGVATALTLDVRPAFEVATRVWERPSWAAVSAHHDRIAAAAYSVSVFTDLGEHVELWAKHRVGDPPVDLGWTGATPADGPRHPVPGMPVANTTPQQGVPGPWDERLPHFRSGATPSVGAELQSEYFVGRADAAAALEALRGLRQWIAPVLRICEIRTVAADPAWLSPTNGRASVGLHFTWVPETDAVLPVLERVERALEPFAPRPHWGKLSLADPKAVRGRYRHADRFAALRDRLDPRGRFRNDLVDRYFPEVCP